MVKSGRRSDWKFDAVRDGYDPSRVMPNGEMVHKALSRLKWYDPELRLQAMAHVKRMRRSEGITEEAAEDRVYCERFGLDRFPSRLPVGEKAGGRVTLEEALEGKIK